MSLDGPSKHWTVTVDGKIVTPRHIEISSRWGTLAWGAKLETGREKRCEGWSFAEAGGGGAVTIPYVLHNGTTLVGMILEDRPNLGSKAAWCAIGGFIDPGESHREAQAREAAEEAGVDTEKARELAGLPATQDRLYYVSDIEKGEGLHTYALEMSMDALEADGDHWRLKEGAGAGFKAPALVGFFPWRTTVQMSPDVCLRSGVALLLAELL